ncbi:hypothetical protein C0J52_15416 [Blattella germanica]|nr:hypothetical protein C0J52_15416 [Blattella germanica]
MKMKLLLLLVVVGAVWAQEEDRDKRQSGYYQGQAVTRGPARGFPGVGAAPPQGFRAAPVDEDEEEDVVSRNTVAPSQGPQALLLVRQSHPTPQPQQYRRPVQIDYQPQPQQPRPQQVRKPPPQQGGRGGPYPNQLQEEELEKEEEEPDRLSLLLPQSKFDCTGKKTGYYADDGLNCEVFHYCQDNARHSWICPEGFVFHQYLYRPINAEEAQTKPNVTLRYHDRYYPDTYYEPEEQQAPQQRPQPHRVPVQVTTPRGRPVQIQQQQLQPTLRPVLFRGPSQVFHSPEEVNIPLQQRRPVPLRKEDEFEYDDTPFRG